MYISANKSEGCAPEIIGYTLVNSIAGSTYQWDVGSGLTNGADTFYSFYNNATVVNASVKINLPGGGNCVIIEDSIVTIHPIPIPKISLSSSELCDRFDSVILSDITTNSASRIWVVDGTSYSNSSKQIKHSFATSGLKSVSLIVDDNNGCRGASQFIDTIIVYPDVNFDFISDTSGGCSPQNIAFELSPKPVSNCGITYKWTFNGAENTSSTKENPDIVKYIKPGNFDVGLSVNLTNGCNHSLVKKEFINISDTLNISLTTTDSVFCLGEEFSLVKTLSPNLGGETTWEFQGLDITEVDSTTNLKSLISSSRGYLSVTLKHRFNGCETAKTFSNLVKINGVKADFNSPDHYHCEVPHTVHLVNKSDSLDATSVYYKWNIYEGTKLVNSSSKFSDSFTFNKIPASYDVELIAYGNNGCSDTIKKKNFIYQDTLDARFYARPKIACVGQEVRFINQTKPSSYLSGDNFKWYFKDNDGTTLLDSSTERSPLYTYQDTGYYDVILIGYNGVHCRDTLELIEAVKVVIPDLDYSINNSTICNNDTIQFLGQTLPKDADFKHSWTVKNLDGIHFLLMVIV